MDQSLARYADIRDSLETGDLLLCAGTDIIAAGIKAVTGSTYSHVAIVRRDMERVMVLEAVREGVVYRPASFLAAHNYDHIAVYRVRPDYLCHGHFDVDKQIAALLDDLGRGYAFKQIGKIWWTERLGLPVTLGGDEHLDTSICSGYASKGDRAGGQDPRPGKPDSFTYPGEFTEVPYRFHACSFIF